MLSFKLFISLCKVLFVQGYLAWFQKTEQWVQFQGKYISTGVGGVWVQLLKVLGVRARVILVLRECIWNAPAVSLVFPAFDDTGSLDSSPRQVVYPPV